MPYRQMFELHSSVMLLVDPISRVIVEANLAAANFYGYSLESLRGMSVSHINAQTEEEIAPKRVQALQGETQKLTFDHRLSNGDIRTVEAHISVIQFKGKPLFFTIIQDITERKKMEEEIRTLAFYDSLTGLSNRRLLKDRLEKTMASGKRSGLYGALIFLDMDNFKPINDIHGHSVGDLLLVEVANRISSCIRGVDTASRFGGDEFTVLIGELNSCKVESVTQVKIIAEKIRTILAEPYVLKFESNCKVAKTIEHECSSSIGVALFLNHEYDADDIIKRADTAMYQSKEAGGNQIRLYDEYDCVTASSRLPAFENDWFGGD